MNKTTIASDGQSLVDVALQELGTVASLFDLADAAGLAITDVLTPGQVLAVPNSLVARPELVDYFQRRAYRVNTGDEAAPATATRRRDFKQSDFSPSDFK